MAATAQGLITTAIHLGQNSAEVHGLVSEVVWADRDTDRAEPRAFVLMQDPLLGGDVVVSSAPEQDGAHVGTAYADEGNEGDLLPYTSGTWDTDLSTPQPTPADVVLEVVRTGSLYNSGEWGWRISTDAPDEVRGSEDLRRMHDTHSPFGDGADKGSGHTICYAPAWNRVIVGYHPHNQARLDYTWRSANAQDPTAWGPTQQLVLSDFRGPNNGRCYTTMWQLPDGAMRWAVLYNPTGYGADMDLDLYGSTDGGETWDLIKERIITDLYGAPRLIERCKVAHSGDWMRLELWDADASTAGLVSAWSADRGATWGWVDGHTDGDGDDDNPGTGDTVDGYETWDVVGVDEAGTFMRVRTQTATTKVRFELASREGGWSVINTTDDALFEATDADVCNVWLASGSGRVFVLIFRSDHHTGGPPTGADYWSVASFIIPLDRLTSGYYGINNPQIEDWTKWGDDDWLTWAGTARLHPKGGQLAWLGDRLGLWRGSINRQTGTTDAAWDKGTLSYFGGASRRPMSLPGPTHFDLETAMLGGSWDVALGIPANGGTYTSTYTSWGWSGGGSPVLTWEPGGMRVFQTPSDRIDWSQNQLISGLSYTMADAGLVTWATRADDTAQAGDCQYPPSGGGVWSAIIRTPEWGVWVTSESLLTAGLTVDVTVHLATDGGLAVYDCSGATTLFQAPAGTLAGITSTMYQFKLAFAHSNLIEVAGASTLFCELGWAEVGDYKWSSTGLLTILGGQPLISPTYQGVNFGCRATPTAACTVVWRDWSWTGGSFLGVPPGYSNPGDVRGWDAMPYSFLGPQGMAVLWGGAGGFAGDSYSVPVQWVYGIGQIMGDSPGSLWRSTSVTTQQITMDAELYGGERARFAHSGMAGISTNSRHLLVQYSDSANMDDPVYYALDGKRYDAVVTGVLEPNVVEVEVPDAGWADGELTGHYLAAEGGNSSLRVAGNVGSTILLQQAGITQALSAYGLTVGATLALWGDSHLLVYEDWPEGVRVIDASGAVDATLPRYMQITIPKPGWGGQVTPPEGHWYLGRLQAGLTLPISVPMSWGSLSDDEQAAVDMQTMASGRRVAYQLGAPRRTIKGKSEGDVDRWRVAFRSMVRSLAGYNVRPVVVCTDDQQLHREHLYARLADSSENDDEGFKWDKAAGRWHKIGHLSLTFEQEV